MKKSVMSMFLGLLVSNSVFAMGSKAIKVTAIATAVATATIMATAVPTPVQAGTLNPPQVVYEDAKVKVEKVWEDSLTDLDGDRIKEAVWTLGEIDGNRNDRYYGEKTVAGKTIVIYPKVVQESRSVVIYSSDGIEMRRFSNYCYEKYNLDKKEILLNKITKDAPGQYFGEYIYYDFANDKNIWKTLEMERWQVLSVYGGTMLRLKQWPGGRENGIQVYVNGEFIRNVDLPSEIKEENISVELTSENSFIIVFSNEEGLRIIKYSILGTKLADKKYKERNLSFSKNYIVLDDGNVLMQCFNHRENKSIVMLIDNQGEMVSENETGVVSNGLFIKRLDGNAGILKTSRSNLELYLLELKAKEMKLSKKIFVDKQVLAKGDKKEVVLGSEDLYLVLSNLKSQKYKIIKIQVK